MSYYIVQVMMYTGQLDLIVGVPLTEAFLMSTKWSGSEMYAKADRLIWRMNPNDKEVAGYVRQVKNFYQVITRVYRKTMNLHSLPQL